MSRIGTPDGDTANDPADGPERKTCELPPAAKRALAEAEARRVAREAEAEAAPKELGGVDGPDPARYGDWEKDGIVSDF